MRPGIGHSLMPSFSTIKRWRPTKAISIPGITNTCSAKNRESVAPAMIGPPSISFTTAGPMIGNAAGDRSSDSQSPVGVLIEAQHLSAEGHAQSHQQEEDADDPGEFTRELVGPEQKDLHHMNQNNRHHEVGAPSVHRADEPAERHLMIQSLQAAPCLAGRGHVNQGQQNSGHKLEKEDGERRAAEHVEPARRVPWHGMFGGFANRRRELQAMVEPFSNLANQMRMAASPWTELPSVPRRRQLPGLNSEHAVLNLVGIFEQAALRWSRGARAVAVVRSAVAGTHKQTRIAETSGPGSRDVRS